ncbi:MAG: hypothetical protein QXR34_05255 [Saccharolobus sp.]
MKVALTDEGEIASAIALNLNNEEIIIVDTSAKIIKEKPDIIIHIIEVIHNPSLSWTYNAWYAMARAGSKIGSLNIYLFTLKDFTRNIILLILINYYGLSKLSGEILELCLFNFKSWGPILIKI